VTEPTLAAELFCIVGLIVESRNWNIELIVELWDSNITKERGVQKLGMMGGVSRFQ